MTVELVVLTPVIVLFALLAVGMGRLEQARQELADAAQSGAQAASVVPVPGQAAAAAAESATPAVVDQTHVCAQPQISTDTSTFFPNGSVRVTVTCQVALADLLVPGMPGSISVGATQQAPVDPYRAAP